jgi:hypothetical protein
VPDLDHRIREQLRLAAAAREKRAVLTSQISRLDRDREELYREEERHRRTAEELAYQRIEELNLEETAAQRGAD